MSQTQSISTAEQLLRARDVGRCELVRGELIMVAPAGWEHGSLAARLCTYLSNHVDPLRLGLIFGAETGFLIERHPDTVRAPDAAYVRRDRIPTKSKRGFFPGAPDLLFEVLSPDDTASDLADKADQWLSAGCQLVGVVDPRKQTVTSYSLDRPLVIYRAEDRFRGEPVLPGFEFALAELFRP